MSVRIGRWFGVPPELIAGEFFEKMAPSDLALCIVLYWWSDRKTSRRFEVKDVEMEARTRLSRRSLLDARKHLSSLGIAVITKTLGGHVYTLCDLKTGLPYPGDPKAKLDWHKKEADGDFKKIEGRTKPSVARGNVQALLNLKYESSTHRGLNVGQSMRLTSLPGGRRNRRRRRLTIPTGDFLPGFDTGLGLRIFNPKADESEAPVDDWNSFRRFEVSAKFPMPLGGFPDFLGKACSLFGNFCH